MKIISWNVNGIRAAADKGLKDFISCQAPDILCLQETKAFPEQITPGMARPEGYLTYWNNPPRKGYAGVAVFSKHEPENVKKTFSGDFDTEGRALIMDYKKFLLINVYFPNGGSGEPRLKYKMLFYDKFLEYIDKIKNRNIIICGDVNTAHKEIDLARPKENSVVSGFLPEERAWLDKLTAHGYIDTFREFDKSPGKYTWWDYKTRARERNVGWRIDYFFVTEQMMKVVKDAFIMPEILGSDHCPVGIELNLKS